MQCWVYTLCIWSGVFWVLLWSICNANWNMNPHPMLCLSGHTATIPLKKLTPYLFMYLFTYILNIIHTCVCACVCVCVCKHVWIASEEQRGVKENIFLPQISQNWLKWAYGCCPSTNPPVCSDSATNSYCCLPLLFLTDPPPLVSVPLTPLTSLSTFSILTPVLLFTMFGRSWWENTLLSLQAIIVWDTLSSKPVSPSFVEYFIMSLFLQRIPS